MPDQQTIPEVVQPLHQAIALLEEEVRQLEEARKNKKAKLRDFRKALASINGTKRRRAQPKQGG